MPLGGEERLRLHRQSPRNERDSVEIFLEHRQGIERLAGQHEADLQGLENCSG